MDNQISRRPPLLSLPAILLLGSVATIALVSFILEPTRGEMLARQQAAELAGNHATARIWALRQLTSPR